jgi:hypothetical protein
MFDTHPKGGIAPMDLLSIRRFKSSPVALALAVWLFGLTAFPSLAAAALAPSRTSQGATATDRQADLEAVRVALENKLVAQKLADYGLSPSEVQAKLPQMSDADVHHIALLSKKLPQGGDDAVGTIIVILVIVILVIVIIKLMNREIIVR